MKIKESSAVTNKVANSKQKEEKSFVKGEEKAELVPADHLVMLEGQLTIVQSVWEYKK